MKRIISLWLSLMLFLTPCLVLAEEEEETEDGLTWTVNADGTLSVWFQADADTGLEWSCTISEPDVIALLSEEYASEDDQLPGTWAALFRAVEGQAGLVTIAFYYTPAGTDQPESVASMEVYTDGSGTLLVHTFNGLTINELDV